MVKRFPDVTVTKDDSKEAKVKFTHQDFDPSKHASSASVNNRTLIVSATINGETYEHHIRDVDINPEPKKTTEKKHIQVTVVKTSPFNMTEKM